MKAQWVKWKTGGGPRVLGDQKYDPPKPWGPWTKIMGVVARCEGNHDTVVMYDRTGVTWGFLQWTFTSGRLQKLLESLKTVPDGEDPARTLWDSHGFASVLKPYGIGISTGQLVNLNTGKTLHPETDKDEIVKLCMPNRDKAMQLAELFADIASFRDVQDAQTAFGKAEFTRALDIKRAPLGAYKTIRALLKDDWDSMAPALFFNLWQNSPGGAYILFMKARQESDTKGSDLFEVAWRRVCRSSYANWGYGDGDPHPRVERIKPAFKEFYGVDLKIVK